MLNFEQQKKTKCDGCGTEMLKSTAMMREGADYILYFCGKNCYQKWIIEAEKDYSE